jgi:tetratricopeptide (TPR) repeat protein
MVFALILLAFALYNYRQRQANDRQVQVQAALAEGWSALGQLDNAEKQYAVSGGMFKADELRKRRAELASAIQSSVQQIIDESDSTRDRARLASAWLLNGDLNWQLANGAVLEAPTTQSTTRASTMPSPAEYLTLAEQAYSKVLADFADQRAAFVSAHFGLAAIAENRHDWPAAREHYKAIIESTNTPPFEKSIAESRIAKLDDLQKPLLLLPATQPVTRPTTSATTQPAGTIDLGTFDPTLGPPLPMPPATAPTTQGSTKTGTSGAATPATQPATQPNTHTGATSINGTRNPATTAPATQP